MNGLAQQQSRAILGAGSGETASRQPAEIESEMSAIDDAISRLSSRSEVLRLRLQSVTRPAQPATANKALAPVQATDLGRALANFAERINALAEAVEDDAQRLAL